MQKPVPLIWKLRQKTVYVPSRYKFRDGSSRLRRIYRLSARLQDVLTDESASDEFCSIIQFVFQHRIYTRDGSIIRLRRIIRLWYKFGQCEYSWQISYDIIVKKTLVYFFVFLLSLRQFFNVAMTSSCKQKLATINREICYNQCLRRIGCCRILTLFPVNLRCLVSPTMCVFHLLGIHLSERTAMTRVSLSTGSNFTNLRCARRF